ncbi:MAG: glycosyltransferase [Bacteroidetes bacterium]|jgi:glycosyltransferase involved in cell wall biosynthesis|nr:glycosyltransferase [Bacteroidota bacterium]
MKIAYIGTYPPRECGIATFTQNLYGAMVTNPAVATNGSKPKEGAIKGFIVAMNDHDQTYNYPEEVKRTIRQEELQDYLEAATFINSSGADVCIIEHEFGIFGGQNGLYILSLIHHLQIPLIVTLHTIVKTPSHNEKVVLKKICKMAHNVVVMSQKAIEFLTEIYDADKSKISLIEHGVPDIQFDKKQSKKEFKLEHKKVLLTFGILSRNKGIETVINALPALIKKHPDLLYIVLGKTHPNVIRDSGEEYRTYLHQLVESHNLENHVHFINEFKDQRDLFKYLSASDIYITPYLNEAQITSGTLSYAIGVGSAVVSTPYWHATELLDEGRGRLFNFNDSDGLSLILMNLLDNPDELKKIRKKAYEYGKTTTWPKSGVKYITLAKQVISDKPAVLPNPEKLIDPLLLPSFSLDHIKRLTDDTGIIQHARFGIPYLKEGYCLDDNARALLMVLMAYKQKKNKAALNLAPVYLSYIHYMQKEDGTFRNFLDFKRTFLDETGSEDSFGRAIWALGYLIGNAPDDSYCQMGKLIFFDASPHFEKIESIRGIANTMLGISYYLKDNPSDKTMTTVLSNLAGKLVDHYEKNSSPGWNWFEPILAYDNGLLPLSLLHAAEILDDDKIGSVAFESMAFLTDLTLKDGYLSIIGNEEWYKKEGERSMFAQQPVDALAMILMYQQAFYLTKDKGYLSKISSCYMWFLGQNELRVTLYDSETKGCFDGLENYGVNRNQGAESTLAYLISHLIMLWVFEEYEKKELKGNGSIIRKSKKYVNKEIS